MSITNRNLVIILCLAVIALLPNLGVYEYKGEESLRTIVAWETYQSGDYQHPTFFGQEYLRKPPLFTWLAIASSKIVGWSELTVRSVSICAFVLSILGIYLFAYALFRNTTLALLASLIYASTGEILLVYAYIGEIDSTFIFFVFSSMAFAILGIHKRQYLWLLAAGVSAGIAYMLKGFPAFLFFAVTVVCLAWCYRPFTLPMIASIIAAGVVALLVPGIWILTSNDPIAAVNMLANETNRASTDLGKVIKHLLVYPLENFAKALPGSLFFMIPLVVWLKQHSLKQLPERYFSLSPLFKAVIAILLINYIPYWISSGAKMRYVLPMIPLFSVIAAYVLTHHSTAKLQNAFVYTALSFIVIRLVMGLVAIPIAAEKRPLINSDRKIAMDLMEHTITNKQDTVSCDCHRRKAICLYISTAYNEVMKRPTITPDWDFYISCTQHENLKLVKSYIEEHDPVYIYSSN